MSTKAVTIGIAAVLVIGIAVITLTSGGGASESAQATDGAFIVEMTPHHESAIEMANVALEQAEHPEIKELAQAIVATQAQEIDELAAIHSDLFDLPVSQGAHGTLGMEEHQMGMDGESAELAGERPFDRAFIDMMIPHHQGAIRMARIEQQSGEDDQLMTIADAIIVGQAKEIEEMNAWRVDWYGSPSPAGGIPAEEEAPSHSMMGH